MLNPEGHSCEIPEALWRVSREHWDPWLLESRIYDFPVCRIYVGCLFLDTSLPRHPIDHLMQLPLDQLDLLSRTLRIEQSFPHVD